MSGGIDLLIVDDDTYWTALLMDLAEEMGFSCECLRHGAGAFEAAARIRPRAVFLDIMMPGDDGLSVLRKLKGDKATAGLKVIVASAKAFAADREEALRLGADAFYAKTEELLELKRLLGRVLGGRPGADVTAAPARKAAFRFRVLGCRGPGEEAGPGTSSVLVDFNGRWVLLDAGTGLRALTGESFGQVRELWVLLSHYHPDHVAGLSSLAPLARAGLALRIAGPVDTRASLQAVVERAFPGVPAERVRQFSLAEGEFCLWPDVRAAGLLTLHPGSTLAIRLEHQGRSLVYCPDNELEDAEAVRSDFSEKLARLVARADVLIHDARYLDADYEDRRGQGHSCPSLAVELAKREAVRRLLLWHLDSGYDEARAAAEARSLRERLSQEHSSLKVEFAAAGMTMEV